jgi:hypothetical protein
MPKKENKIKLTESAQKAARNFCNKTGRDLSEFIEEAIVEKIEFEETVSDMPSSGMDELFAEDRPEDEIKTKH